MSISSPLADRLTSRKFWAAVAAGTVVAFGEAAGLNFDESEVWSVAIIASSYIFGQGAVDFIRTLYR